MKQESRKSNANLTSRDFCFNGYLSCKKKIEKRNPHGKSSMSLLSPKSDYMGDTLYNNILDRYEIKFLATMENILRRSWGFSFEFDNDLRYNVARLSDVRRKAIESQRRNFVKNGINPFFKSKQDLKEAKKKLKMIKMVKSKMRIRRLLN